MSSETPRLSPTEISNTTVSIFRLIAQVVSQPTSSTLILKSPSDAKTEEMITLSNVKLTMADKTYETDQWYEFICRASDSGDVGFLVLDSVSCPLMENEQMSIIGVVALQNLAKRFPDLY